jgi:hypothetical protein
MKKTSLIHFLLAALLVMGFIPAVAGAVLTPIMPADGATGDVFGSSVSLTRTNGEYLALIGAPGFDENIGKAYVYKRVVAGWEEISGLTVSGVTSPDFFGYSVDMSGNYAIIGAPYDDNEQSGKSNAGSAYIFYRNESGNWVYHSKLCPTDCQKDAFFGQSVAIDGNYAIVGAYKNTPGIYDYSGSAYVFELENGSWVQKKKLVPADIRADDYFGMAVSISGDYAVVGALNHDTASFQNIGAVYVFNRSATGWIQQTKLIPSDGSQNILFGGSVSIDGNTIAAGAYGASTSTGAAYVYKLTGGNWTPFQKLTTAGAPYDKFGASISVSGTKIIVGAKGAASSTGAAYVFEQQEAGFVQLPKITAEDGDINHEFGASAAVAGEFFVVGAKGYGSNKGAAYLDTSGVAENLSPTISYIGPKYSNDPVQVSFPFSVGDTGGTILSLAAESDNAGVVPNTNITISRNGTIVTSVTLGAEEISADLSINLMPVAYGQANITITVSDGVNETSETFPLTITHKPGIDPVAPVDTDEDVPRDITINVQDEDQDTLTINATSSNPALLPVSNIKVRINGSFISLPYDVVLGSSTFADVALYLQPVDNAYGTSEVTITVDDGGATVQQTFTFTAAPVNDAPVFKTTISARTINEDQILGPITVELSDIESDTVILTGRSSDEDIVSNEGINIVQKSASGNTSIWSVTVTPLNDAFGTAVITLMANDNNPDGITESAFSLTIVQLLDDKPKICSQDSVLPLECKPIPAQPAAEDTKSDILFKVYHGDNVSMRVSGQSGNETIVSTNNMLINGSSASYGTTPVLIDRQASVVLSITPQKNQFGDLAISITAEDSNARTETTQFILNVAPKNDPPTIEDLPFSAVTPEDTPVFVDITVNDVDDPALEITAQSNNTTVVPNANIEILGDPTDRTRTLKITPGLNQTDIFGNTSIIVTVKDPSGLKVEDSFRLTVTSVNDAPTLFLIHMITDDTLASLTADGVPADVVTDLAVLKGQEYKYEVDFSQDIVDTIGETDAETYYDLIRDRSVRNFTTPEDTTLSTTFQVEDVDTGDLLTISAFSSNPDLVTDGNIKITGTSKTRTLTVTPLANANGQVEITLRAEDEAESFDEDSFILTIGAANDAPQFPDTIPNQTTDEDTPLTVYYSITDDEEPDTFTVTAISSSPGIFTVFEEAADPQGPVTNRKVTITPQKDKNGTASVSLSLKNTTGQTIDTVSFSVTVRPMNDGPEIVSNILDGNPDTPGVTDYITNEDTAVTVTGLKVRDVDNDTLTITPVSNNPTLVPDGSIVKTVSGGDVSFTVTPALNANSGADLTSTATITVTISDQFESVTTSFVVIVRPVNDPPALSGLPLTYTADEDFAAISIGFTVSDVDDAFNALTVSVSTFPTGVITVTPGNETGASRTLNVQSIKDQNSLTGVEVTVIVKDAAGASKEGKCTFTVRPINDPPTFTPGFNPEYITDEDTALTISITVDDVDGDLVKVTGVSNNRDLIPDNQIKVTSVNRYRDIELTPALHANSGDNLANVAGITMTVSDDKAQVTGSFNFKVRPVNDAPTVTIGQASPIKVNEDFTTFDVAFTVSDVDDVSTVITTLDPVIQIITVDKGSSLITVQKHPEQTGASRTLTLSPVANRNGSAKVIIQVQDDGGLRGQAEFTVEVAAVNDPPTFTPAFNETYQTNEDTALAPIVFTVADEEQKIEVLTVNAVSDNQSVIPDTYITKSRFFDRWTLNIRPLENAPFAAPFSQAQIWVTIGDTIGSTTASFTVQVNQVNDDPTITGINNALYSVAEDGVFTLDFTVDDVEDGASNLLNGTHLWVSINGDKNATSTDIIKSYTLTGTGTARQLTINTVPNANSDALGTDDITISLLDSYRKANAQPPITKLFTFSVTSVNDLPTIQGIKNTYTINEGGVVEIKPNPNDPATDFSVCDVDTEYMKLTLTSDDDPVLFPPENLEIEYLGDVFTGNHVLSRVNPAGDSMFDAGGCPLDDVIIRVSPGDYQYGGPAEIILTVSDDKGGEVSRTFEVLVLAVNDPPVISGTPPNAFEDEGTGDTISVAEIWESYSFVPTLEDPDNPVDTLTVKVKYQDIKNGGNPTETLPGELNWLDWLSFNQTTRTLSGTPTEADYNEYMLYVGQEPPNYAILPYIIMEVTDPSGLKNEEIFQYRIMLTKTELPPVINGGLQIDDKTIKEDEVLQFNFTVKDKNGGNLTVDARIEPAGSKLVLDSGVEIFNAAGQPVKGVPFAVDRDVPVTLTLKVRPDAQANSEKPGFETADIVITATDGMFSAESPFTLTVEPVADNAVITYNDGTGFVPLNNQIITVDELNQVDPAIQLDLQVTDYDWGSLTLTAVSDKQTLLPTDNIDIGAIGIGPEYSMAIGSNDPVGVKLYLTPIRFTSGTAKVTLTAKNETRTNSVSFFLVVEAINNPPEITSTTDTWNMDESTQKDFPLTVKDSDGDRLKLTIAITQGQTILPLLPQNIKINGIGYDAAAGAVLTKETYATPITVTIIPVPYKNGDVTIQFQVQEMDTVEQDASDLKTLLLKVAPVNDAPTISQSVDPQTINEDDAPATDPIPVTVGDVDGDPLKISVISSNTDVVIAEDVYLVDALGQELALPRTIGTDVYANPLKFKIYPVDNANSDLLGFVYITVTAFDGKLNASSEFRLVVAPRPDDPWISEIPGQKMNEDQVDGLQIPFMVRDFDQETVTVKVRSGKQDTVPNDINHLIVTGPAGVVSDTKSGIENEQEFVYVTLKTSFNADIPLILTVYPAPDQNAPSDAPVPMTITVIDSDAGTPDAVRNFDLTISPLNDPPIIDGIEEGVPKSTTQGTPIDVFFDVTDIDNILADLTVTVVSSDETVVRNDDSHLDLRVSSVNGNVRTYRLIITPNENAEIEPPYETTIITVRANDKQEVSTKSFELRVFPNTALLPGIELGFGSSQNMEEDTVKEFPFAVLYTVTGIPTQEPASFTVFGISSKATLVPSGNISAVYQNSEDRNSDGNAERHNYLLRVTPFENAFSATLTDTTQITIVADVNGYTSDEVFSIYIRPLNDSPEIHPAFEIPVQTFAGLQVKLDFTISDVETVTASLGVSSILVSDPQKVVLNRTLACTGGSCTLTVTPAPNVTSESTAVIAIRVDDKSGVTTAGQESVSELPFDFVVYPNHATTVAIPDLVYQTPEDVPILVEFKVADQDAGVIGDMEMKLTVSQTAANPVDLISGILVSDLQGNPIVNALGVEGTLILTSGDWKDLILRITSKTGKVGAADLTITLKDPSGNSGSDSFTLQVVRPGDLNNDGKVDLTDAIMALNVMSGRTVAGVNLAADVDGDGKIGIEDLIYILREVGLL